MARYVDAEKAEKWLHREDWGTPDERWRPEQEFGGMLDALPAEDVAPVVHAYWHNGVCSSCGAGGNAIFINGELVLLHEKYCPNCGAKMEG